MRERGVSERDRERENEREREREREKERGRERDCVNWRLTDAWQPCVH